MNNRDNAVSHYLKRLRFDLRTAALVALTISAPGCGTPRAAEAQKPAAPAKVENAVKEGDLATVTLSPQAEARLGIRTAPVEFTSVTRTRTFGGEVVLPPDSTIVVSAPMAGTILAGASGSAPVAGMMLRKGQAVFRLLPLLAPERDARSLAEKELTDAQTRVDAARVKLDRAEQLLRDKAGSVKQVEQAREDLTLAEHALKAAREKKERILRAPLEGDTSIAVMAPEDGMVQKVHAGTGQKVAGSTPLFEIASLKSIWLRVPVYVGDLASLDRRQAAKVHNLGDSRRSPILSARPIEAPPTANVNASTIDLYYALPAAGPFRPGQKVGVTLTLLGAEESLVVPHSAIIRDVHSGEWVYENTVPQTYVRRRVEVRYVTGTQAVLARGPAAGTKVVITGAAELFGTEFGTGK
ncbi:MAG: efflux RND transporter periplasmic adaptor subunit [Acidobacteriota bacterium]